jgi:hypothetical protein
VQGGNFDRFHPQVQIPGILGILGQIPGILAQQFDQIP